MLPDGSSSRLKGSETCHSVVCSNKIPTGKSCPALKTAPDPFNETRGQYKLLFPTIIQVDSQHGGNGKYPVFEAKLAAHRNQNVNNLLKMLDTKDNMCHITDVFFRKESHAP